MRNFTPEEEEYFIKAAEEAEEWDEKYGGISYEDFWQWVDEMEEEERRKRLLRKENTKLNIVNTLKKISGRFIRA